MPVQEVPLVDLVDTWPVTRGYAYTPRIRIQATPWEKAFAEDIEAGRVPEHGLNVVLQSDQAADPFLEVIRLDPGTVLRVERPSTKGDAPWIDAIARGAHGVLVRARFDRPGNPNPTELEFRSSTGLTTEALRRVGHAWLVQRLRDALTRPPMAGVLGESWITPLRNPGRRGRAPWEYAEAAEAYARAYARNSRSPISQLVRDEQRRYKRSKNKKGLFPHSLSWWKDTVREARRRGFLTPTARGKAGGELTPLGEQVLREHRAEMQQARRRR